MKKQLLLILMMSLILLVTACGTSSGGREAEVGGNETVTFQATILEIQDGYYLVEPMEGSAESYSAQIANVYGIRVVEQQKHRNIDKDSSLPRNKQNKNLQRQNP